MQQAQIIVDKDYQIGTVERTMFGVLIEHLGRHIYTGMYEPSHPTADENGFRQDVIDLVKPLNLGLVRYPGGNFVSGYKWEDTIGPKENRPTRLELAWGTIETNHFGLHEFVAWCRKIGAEPYLAVNLGTRGPEEARNLVEYCNHPGGTYWSDLRRKNGAEEPFNIKYWGLGNEMGGAWQIGMKTADEYARIALEAAKVMKWTDPTIHIICDGFSDMTWRWKALQSCYHLADYLSIHCYLGNRNGDSEQFMGDADKLSYMMESTAAVCDAVQADKHQDRRMAIALDEWNVWYHENENTCPDPKWVPARHMIEDVYTMEDALVVGDQLISILNHADRVKIACMAQLVNVIGTIMTEPNGRCWTQTTYHPFLLTSNLAKGVVLKPIVTTPIYDSEHRKGINMLTAALTYDEATRQVTVFAVNRSLKEPLEVSVELRAFGGTPSLKSWKSLFNSDLKAVNTVDDPNNVTPVDLADFAVKDGKAVFTLPKASWNAICLQLS